MAQIIEGLVYKIFPSLREWEKTAEQAMTYYKGFVDTTKSIGDYLNNNGGSIIDRIEKSVGTVLNDLKDDVKKNVKISPSILKPFASYAQPNKPGNKAKPAAHPSQASSANPASSASQAEAYERREERKEERKDERKEEPKARDEQGVKYAARAARAEPARAQPYSPPLAKPTREPYQPVRPSKPATGNSGKSRAEAGQEMLMQEQAGKKNSLDELVNDFKNRMKQFNASYEFKMDIYDRDSVIKSYASAPAKADEPELSAEQFMKPSKIKPNKTYLESILEKADEKYISDSMRITELYNQGYRTNDIVKEAAKKGFAGIKSYNDITDRVAVGLGSGMDYSRSKYNNAIASKLGAREQVISDYLAGKSYSEIKESFKSSAKGMNISDSSILKIMHQYEQESGEKAVGKRKGKTKSKSK